MNPPNRHSWWLTLFAALLIAARITVPAQADATDYTATVDPTIQYQTWQGWGTSLAWWAKVAGGFAEPARSDYMDKAFDPVKGLGLNVVRYNIGGGENPLYLSPNKQYLQFRTAVPGYEPSLGVWDWTADANQRWVLQEAIKRGANQLEAFSNSPPWWMTKSGSVTGNHGGADNLKPEDDAVFADYLAAVVKHFHDTWGITFRDVEPLNEPSGGWSFGNGQEGCHIDRPHQNALVKATGAALAKLGIGYTTVTASDESIISDADKTFGFYDADALKALSKINTHSYGGGDRTQLFDFATSHGKDLWLSEDGDGDASGLSMSRHILDDIHGLHATSWVTWQVVDVANGWGFLKSPQNDETTTTYTLNKKYYVMGQYSKFIRPGCKIIAITDPDSLAALNPRTNTLIVVTTNSGDAGRNVTYDLSGFTRRGAAVTAYRTSATEDGARLPDEALMGGRFAASLPARSVTTFVIAGMAYSGPAGIDYRRYYTLTSKSGGGESQQWGLLGLGGGWYKIVNRVSGLVLDVSQASLLSGAEVLQYDDNGGENQQWRLAAAGGGAVKIINRRSGLRLNSSLRLNGTGNPPTPGLTQESDSGSANQLWLLRPADAKNQP